jgi:hypothetical protein
VEKRTDMARNFTCSTKYSVLRRKKRQPTFQRLNKKKRFRVFILEEQISNREILDTEKAYQHDLDIGFLLGLGVLDFLLI